MDPGQSIIYLYNAAVMMSWRSTLALISPGFNQESKRKDSGEFYTMRDLVMTFKKPGIWCSSCQVWWRRLRHHHLLALAG